MRARYAFLLALLLFAVPTLGQTLPAAAGRAPDFRLMIDLSIGSAAGLGFKLPSKSLGFSIEKPMGVRFELQLNADYSPDHKAITNDGNGMEAGEKGLFWLNRRFAAIGGMRFTRLWTSQFDKSAFHPLLGIVIRNKWDDGSPGRFYLTYEFPTGCVWATATNPCILQSNRLQGVTVNQEFRLWSHFRYGVSVSVYHFCDQGNQYAPKVPRSCHFTETSSVNLRFEFPGSNNNRAY